MRPATALSIAAAAAGAGAALALARGVRQPGPRLPGDRLVRRAVLTRTMRARMPGAPDAVWPWLAQLGAGRGGWYSIDLIDNGGRPSARAIDPDLQRIAPGDRLEASTLGGPPFVVTSLEDHRSLVTVLRARRGWLRVSYAYVIDAAGPGASTLTARLRMGGHPGVVALMLSPMVLLGHEVGQRVQFARLRRRVSGR
ncbi:MAG: hypothetical protein ACKORG_01420 [Actinomycetota bacterium]